QREALVRRQQSFARPRLPHLSRAEGRREERDRAQALLLSAGMTRGPQTGRAIAFAFAAATCYGLIPSFFRAGYEAGIPAVESALVRTTLMIAATGAFVLARGESLAMPRAAWPALGVQALATATISLCYGAAVQFIPVGLTVIIFYTCPLMILL